MSQTEWQNILNALSYGLAVEISSKRIGYLTITLVRYVSRG